MLMQITCSGDIIIYKTYGMDEHYCSTVLGSVRLVNVFLKEVSYALQSYICLIKNYSKNSNCIKYY